MLTFKMNQDKLDVSLNLNYFKYIFTVYYNVRIVLLVIF